MKKAFTLIGLVSMAAFSNAQIVINEIYTGGGILGATLSNDFIELKNIGSTTATLNGATIQYASASGEFNQYHTLPNISLPPGQTYLIVEGSENSNPILNLLNPNLVVNLVLNFDGSGPLVGVGVGLSLTAGKVALASNSTKVTGPTAPNVLDFVGYGLANQYEGGAPAPSPTILNSISRLSGDTNHNLNDFTATLASPQSGTLAVSDIQTSGTRGSFIKNSLVKNDEIFFAEEVQNIKVYTLSGQVVYTGSAKSNSSLNVSQLGKGNYIVTGTINNQPVSQKVLKD